MKSAPKLLLPVLLVVFSLVITACQSTSTPGPTAEQAPVENGSAEQKPVNPITVDQIINIVWQWAEWSETASAAQSVVPDPENYTITFWEDGTFVFKADCNSGNGSYTVTGNQIEFGPMMSTLAMCPPGSLHDQYLAMLGQVESLGESEGKLVLVLKENAGEMRFNNGGSAEASAPEIKTLFIGPEKVDCVGEAPMKCYQVKETPDGEWQNFYSEIEGFQWEPGYTYELRVAVHPVENPPAGGSSLRYELIEVVDKTEMTTENPQQYIEILSPVANTQLDASQLILVSGMGGGLFEGNVVVQALDAAGDELALQPTTIQSPEAGTGGEGPWEIALKISVNAPTPGKIVAFATSPQDGSLTASDEVSVTFLPGMAVSPSLENTAWQLTSLTDGTLNSSLAIFPVTATFLSENAQMAGVAGCNRYFGAYTLDGDQLSIPGPLGVTRMMCPEPQMSIESSYLAALDQVDRYEINAKNELNLLNSTGSPILIFQVDPYSITVSYTRAELANATFLSDWTDNGLVQLANGQFRASTAEGSASDLTIFLSNFAAFGDVDQDGQEDALVILVSNTGGSGSFYDLSVIRKQGEVLTNIAKLQLGDRIQIKSIRIENGEIVVEMLTHGSGDALCCPTEKVVNYYELQDGELVQTRSETGE